MINIFKEIWFEIKKIYYNDPYNKCELYKNKGCAYVDGILCDYPNCEMNKNYIEEKNKENDSI